MRLTPLNTFLTTGNRIYLLERERETLLVKHYAGEASAQRHVCERALLDCWRELGFNVPRLHAIEIPRFQGDPYLVMDYIAGCTLQELLGDSQIDWKEKERVLGAVFRANCRRHRRAFADDDLRLIHHDSNSRNVICAGDEFYSVDFEKAEPDKDVLLAIGLEINKFCRWLARDLGRERVAEILSLLIESYGEEMQFLTQAVACVHSRPSQLFHRLSDRWRKAADPNHATKYDIADALDRLLPVIRS